MFLVNFLFISKNLNFFLFIAFPSFFSSNKLEMNFIAERGSTSHQTKPKSAFQVFKFADVVSCHIDYLEHSNCYLGQRCIGVNCQSKLHLQN